MRKSCALLLAVLACPLLFAQNPAPAPAPTPPAASSQATPAGTAIFFFYRLRKYYASALKPSIYSDKQQLLRMRNGRFIELQLPAGEHTLTSNFPGNGLVIDAKAGETYYIRMDITAASFLHTAKGEVFRVDPGQGKFEVSQLKPGEPEDTKADAHPEKD